jgi:hypothetical protein
VECFFDDLSGSVDVGIIRVVGTGSVLVFFAAACSVTDRLSALSLAFLD